MGFEDAKAKLQTYFIKTIPVNLILRCLSRVLPFLRLLPLPCQVFPVLQVHLRKTSLPGNPGFNASELLLMNYSSSGVYLRKILKQLTHFSVG